MNDEFENALAWFRAAPAGWIESAKKDLASCAEWVWEVLQGDFNDNASTAQAVTGTVISMIPFVDQVCDVRDVIANCKKIDREPDHTWHWVSLALTLIGLFPTLGSLVKGCGKVIFASIRKGGELSGTSPQIARLAEASISQLNKFLGRPEVCKTLTALKIDNPYKYLAKEMRKVEAQVKTTTLLRAFDQAAEAAGSMMELVSKWGSDGLTKKALDLLRTIGAVRRRADVMLAKAVRPVQEFLAQVARRLEIEADTAHRANLNALNPHAFTKPSLTEEIAELSKVKPAWADDTGKIVYDKVLKAPSPATGWTSTVPDSKRGAHPLDKAHDTFHTIQALIIPPGTTLYRVIDPSSSDNSICWMTKAEFEKLKSKDDWRRRFAVWRHWNSNGEFVTYTVPPGKGLHVWEGVTASQRIKGTQLVLEGGARQIVVNPADLVKAYVGKREQTGWGYGDKNRAVSLVGVPVQKNNWFERE
jgi:hypothetical protein